MTKCLKICRTCYSNLSEEQNLEYALVSPHNLVHKNSAENQRNCTTCKKLIVQIKPAIKCRGCIEKFLDTDKKYLDEGWGAPVYNQQIEG